MVIECQQCLIIGNYTDFIWHCWRPLGARWSSEGCSPSTTGYRLFDKGTSFSCTYNHANTFGIPIIN